jgi:ferredoxin-NADP reductase
MEEHVVKIQSIAKVTHNVRRYVTERPAGYNFISGQATEVSINEEKWKDEERPFTFTCLPDDNFLEFTIKSYTDHKGVTNKLLDLKEGDELIVREVFGAIQYKNEGIFIAGGAGVTPFVSILRNLRAQGKVGKNKLIFANKTKNDIIYEGEFRNMLGENFINILSEEKTENYLHGHINKDFLKRNKAIEAENIYLCGPPPMMESVQKQFQELDVDMEKVVTEDM